MSQEESEQLKGATALANPAHIAHSLLTCTAAQWHSELGQGLRDQLRDTIRTEPNRHPAITALTSVTHTTNRTAWTQPLTHIQTQFDAHVKEWLKVADAEHAQIIKSWMAVRQFNVTNNQPYKNLKWLNTKKRYKNKIQRVWSTVHPSSNAHCLSYGCTAPSELNTCKRCHATLQVSASPDHIHTNLIQFFRHKFRTRPAIDPTVFARHHTHPNHNIATAQTNTHAKHATLNATQHIMAHLYSTPSTDTQSHYAHIMDPIPLEEWDHDLSSAIASKPSELRSKLFQYMEGCRQLTYGARCLSLTTDKANVRGRSLAGAVVVPTFANKAIVCCPLVFLYIFTDMHMHMYVCMYL